MVKWWDSEARGNLESSILFYQFLPTITVFIKLATKDTDPYNSIADLLELIVQWQRQTCKQRTTQHTDGVETADRVCGGWSRWTKLRAFPELFY